VSEGRREERKRLFVACDLPATVERVVVAWQRDQLAPHTELRITASLHLTLCFLGDVEVAAVPDVVAALEGVAFAPFALGLGKPVFLPEHGGKNVVALTVADPSGALARLQAGMAGALAARGLFELPRRRFLAHLTVARFRRRGHPFSLQNVNIEGFGVDKVVLYSSLLERAGAVHTPVAIFPASQ
jgi:2'-5' RNA ligase